VPIVGRTEEKRGGKSPLLARLCHTQVRVVGLKRNKDLTCMNELFEAGKLRPVLDGP
jgi:hypothetical protein